MKNKIYLLIALCYIVTTGTAQKISLNGYEVDIDKVPLNGPLQLDNQTNKSNQQTQLKSATTTQQSTHVSVFKANNNKYFALSKNTEFVLPNNSISNKSGKIEIYDGKGSLLWSKETELPVLNCKLSNDGKYCNAILYNWTEVEETEYLIVLDKRGKEIYKEENVSRIHPNSNKDIFYYTKFNVDTTYLKYNNLVNGNKWEVTVPKKSRVGAVSENGSNAIICSNEGLFSYNSNGKLLWSEPSLIGG
ncbi:MAG: hypothetical protein JW717_02190 [Marinilabiliaceae bacterium]|nr:hypothetical protein [Marinilabiliaceae bacterium]